MKEIKPCCLCGKIRPVMIEAEGDEFECSVCYLNTIDRMEKRNEVAQEMAAQKKAKSDKRKKGRD